jgi:hypothetical protein
MAGRAFVVRGGDGVQRTLVQTTMPGVNGKGPGIYEYLLEQFMITHQRYIPGGQITGMPNP